jgi:hypothetical protein
MLNTGRLLCRCALLAGLVGAAGCAPAYGSGGVALGVSSGQGLELRSAACTSLGTPTARSGHLALSSTGGFAGMRSRLNTVIATYALGARSDPARPSAAWKRVATGEC